MSQSVKYMDDCPDSRNIASFRLPFSRGWRVKPLLSSGDEDLQVARSLSVLVVDMLPGSLQKVEEKFAGRLGDFHGQTLLPG